MEVLSQAPQPTIVCYHSIVNGVATKVPYQSFTPNAADTSGRNLQSYNFERSIENFGGSFSFTVKEDTENLKDPFMDKVQPLDLVVISESGSSSRCDFIGVVTTVSVGGMASNLNKVVTVSGKSIEWLFSYFNINCDIKSMITENDSANKTMLADLSKKQGTEGITIKDVALESFKTFKKYVSGVKGAETSGYAVTSNYLLGDIINLIFGEDFIDAADIKLSYPISSNLFTSGKINIIDYLKNLFPSPLYEIFGFISDDLSPKLCIREVPYDNPKASYKINPTQLTDYTLTRSCEEVYTAFFSYIEGSELSPDQYMNIIAAQGTEKGYNFTQPNKEKVKKYGYQLLTCSFVGFNNDPKTVLNKDSLKEINEKLNRWFSKLDEMYTGDFTIVNLTNEKPARIGEWIEFAKGLYYVISEKHSWTYGDNPMINYQVTRGGKYTGNEFKPIERLSTVYKEFE